MINIPSLHVLRGSKTAPDVSISEARELVKVAEHDIKEAHAKLKIAQESIHNIQKINVDGLSQPTTDDLITIIGQLNSRIDELEKKEELAVVAKSKGNEVLNRTMKQLACGGIAGATARTVVAPIDRVKILMQTQFISHGGGPAKYTGVVQTMQKIFAEEGFSKLWRGNVTNIARVAPYSATQFASYDYYKNNLFGDSELKTHQRLMAGALAGATATTFTHPLDLIRLRLNVQPELTGAADAARSIMAEGGAVAFYKGYAPTVLSLAPFISINFAAFDTLKKVAYPDPDAKRNNLVVLGLGACAGLFAQTCCFPLDTVRRRMQMKGRNYSSTVNAFTTIFAKEGMAGFYKGMLPNAIKVVPNNSIRFLVYELLKTQFGMTGRRER